jgi:cytochrome c peroxidase
MEMRVTPLPSRILEPAGSRSTPDKIALGRRLFFEPLLSTRGDVACATCHNPQFGWADGRPTPIGTGGSGLGPNRTFIGSNSIPVLTRNVPTVLNVAFNGWVNGSRPEPKDAPMFWDGRIAGLEAQAVVPLTTAGEMCDGTCDSRKVVDDTVARLRALPEYPTLFRRAFGGNSTNALTAPHLAAVIAAFERSLVTPDSRFDRYQRGEDPKALTELEQSGLRIFQEAGCIQCHGGPMFSDYKLHNIGVIDSKGEPTRAFRTPTLRQLRHTAPYMHNGSLRSIRDVLLFYEGLTDHVAETLDGGDKGSTAPLDPLLLHLKLDPADFPALEAFLDTLSSEYPK